ncbi:MAG: phytoene desaturase family protein [Acholeplasma sp.]|nr:phytoene desaturase family protein [Acholeplasma sp.]
MKKIAIIGAGPGGLAAGMVLSKKGYQIDIYEKDFKVGGRSQRLSINEYHFDLGPTFLMYIDILKEVFNEAGYELEKELELIRLDSLYTLMFKDVTFDLSKNPMDNKKMYDRYQMGMGDSYLKWLKAQENKLASIESILKKPFPNLFHFLRKDVIKALPYLHPFQSVYKHLSTFNKDDNFIHSLSFQAKYLGMASYQAPSIFTILPYLEHALGLYHVKGGLNQINETMAKLIIKNGGAIHLNHTVNQILIEDKRVNGIIVNDEIKHYDHVILNADFAYSMNHLVDEKALNKYKPIKLNQKKFSVSTFMVYLGLDKTYDLKHHEIIFSKDYEHYLKGLMKGEFDEDFSVYVHNPSLIDDSYAPKGHSSLYILIPVPNLKQDKDWETYGAILKEQAISLIEAKHGINLKDHIVVSKMITPIDWANNYHVQFGAVFNLAHNLGQMLCFRPQNKFNEIKGLFLVGGGTHPGSGLPTIYQSALILKHYL